MNSEGKKAKSEADYYKKLSIKLRIERKQSEKLIFDYKYLLANFTSCPQIFIDNPSFVQSKKPTEKDMEWAREKISEYEADIASQEPEIPELESIIATQKDRIKILEKKVQSQQP